MPVPLPLLPPLWLEARVPFEAAALFRSPIWQGEGVAPGEGRPVLLVPGFLAGDGSLSSLTRWLDRAGYATSRGGIRINVACSGEACAALEARLESLVAATGRRAAIVGHSRGGVFARALAARRPDLVAGIVALGTPMVQPLAVHPVVLAQAAVVAALGLGRVPGCFSVRCLAGPCCAAFREAMTTPLAAGVGYVGVYSRTDGVVDWRSCLDPAADALLEVRASHCGMSLNAQTYAAVALALAGLAARQSPEPGLADAA